MWFQVHYPSLSGFFSSFARATGSLSVAREYLALRDGPRRFRPAFTCPVLLRCQTDSFLLSLTGLSPSMVALSRAVLLKYFESLCLVLQPHQDESRWFRLIRFR